MEENVLRSNPSRAGETHNEGAHPLILQTNNGELV